MLTNKRLFLFKQSENTISETTSVLKGETTNKICGKILFISYPQGSISSYYLILIIKQQDEGMYALQEYMVCICNGYYFLHGKKKPFNAREKAFLGSGKPVKKKKESSLYLYRALIM